MQQGTAQKISNAILSGAAGSASFLFSLTAFLTITEFNTKLAASIIAGAFCLLVSYIASERPNSESARALAALGDRLLAVEDGDLISPAPEIVVRTMPAVAAAVDSLFAEVRSSIDNAHALGMYDPVTSLPNRLHFRAEADKLLGERATGPADQPPAAMLFVDLDRFKAVNDSLGHARGDQLLILVANRLRVVVSAEVAEDVVRRPLIARLAGDEFTLFFPAIRSAAEVERVARRIALAISEPFELHGHSVDIGASIGIAISPQHGTSIESLMRAADIAMYRAKSLGGGQHCLFSDTLAREHQEKVDTENALSEAVQRGEFLLALQPQLSLRTGKITGAEALLRWQHPRDGLRQPNSFIPVAEQTGLIADIGEWVIAEVASMLGAWHKEGNVQRIAFNVSPRQLDRADFFSRMRAAFAEQDVPLSLIELEFTESAAMEVSATVLAEIAALRADGAKIARVIVQAVVQLIHGVGCEVVAEAVETVAQADILRAMGCQTVQGFIFAHPMFEDEYRAWVLNAERGAVQKRA